MTDRMRFGFLIHGDQFEAIGNACDLELFRAVMAQPEELTGLSMVAREQSINSGAWPGRVPPVQQTPLLHISELRIASGVEALIKHRSNLPKA
jgi:hypothetical protein